jgi:hypothetical protein
MINQGGEVGGTRNGDAYGRWWKPGPLQLLECKIAGSFFKENTVSGSRAKGYDFCVRFEVFTAVTMKNVAFWDIESQFVLHRRNIISLLQSPAS